MKNHLPRSLSNRFTLLMTAVIGIAIVQAETPGADGSGKVSVTGELKQWHKVTLSLDGPYAHENDKALNPFTELAFNVTFTHESGSPGYKVPGYFAADGNAAISSADSGTKWLVNLSPDKTGIWTYKISFTKGVNSALTGEGTALNPFNGINGSFTIVPSDKTGRDFRSKGRLQYVGRHHLQFAGSKEYFIKVGSDAPETFLAYTEFDNTVAMKAKVPLKTWAPHLKDWQPGDPTWENGRGKSIVGAINYLSGMGANAFSFLTYNAGGDGDNVWPFVHRDDPLHYDCSKLDQWAIVFDHAQKLGLFLHFKTQETENDDANGPGAAQSLDGGNLGIERKLYYRELIARFGHCLALNWNFGEENTQTPEQQKAQIDYVAQLDPYQHLRVIHTYPNQQEKVYRKLLGKQSQLTGVSLQNEWNKTHQHTCQWLNESAKSGTPWVVANDEQGDAATGVPPDPGYQGFNGKAGSGDKAYDLHDIRKFTLWGNLMAGGAGVEYYFGYKLPQNDLVAEDYRSREKSWQFGAIALAFFHDQKIPFQDMTCRDELIGNTKHDNSQFCLAKENEIYLIYLPNGGSATVTLPALEFSVSWFNPRSGEIAKSSSLRGTSLTAPDTSDWLAVVRRN